uniref:hypothetical protein n=1 Tax=Trebonia sp. TaxID=2767075 RepID=UPI002639FC1A
PKRHLAARRAVLVTGAGCLAVGGIAGTLVASGHGTSGHLASKATPAYAVRQNPNGTITLDVYKTSGIAAANARLRQLGAGQVVVVPVVPGCASVASPPAAPQSGPITTQVGRSDDGSITVNAQGIPAGDIMVVGVEFNADGTDLGISELASPPAPSCVPAPPAPGGAGSGSGSGA